MISRRQSNRKRLRSVRRRLIVEKLGERRVFAAITGDVFHDADGSFRREPGEESLAGRVVYLDTNLSAKLDYGDRVAITDESGAFTFADVADGSYLVRLYNGTHSQHQTFPLGAVSNSTPITADGVGPGEVLDYVYSGSEAFLLTADSLVGLDVATGSTQVLELGFENSALQTLPDGNLLVLGGSGHAASAWVVDPITRAATEVDLSGNGGGFGWSGLAVNDAGVGILISDSPTTTAAFSFDASDIDSGIQVTEQSTLLPAGTQALTSDAATRSVLAWTGDDGLALSLWSNASGNLVTASPVEVIGATELLAFSDETGILVLRTDVGGVRVVDADAEFATLFDFDSVTGPVLLDATRDLLLTVSATESTLNYLDLRTGGSVSQLTVDLTGLGALDSIVADEASGYVTVVGALGYKRFGISSEVSHQVGIQAGSEPAPLTFGLRLTSENSAPVLANNPHFVLPEDASIQKITPGVLEHATDPDPGDRFIALQTSNPANGVGVIEFNGTMRYTPNVDFVGTDSMSFRLHDGRDFSSAEVTFTVTPVPDAPSGIDVNVNPIPEHSPIGYQVGLITIHDIDVSNDHLVTVSDPRFEFIDEALIFVGGGLDFENESQIPLEIEVYDPYADESIVESVILTVVDEDDPITAITPDAGSVFENSPGEQFANIVVIDQDYDQEHKVTVDDDRFEVVDGVLQLKEGVAVDYEDGPTILLQLTATNEASGDSLTEEFVVSVHDIAEAAGTLELSNDTVVELEPGASVGIVSVNGYAGSIGYTVSSQDTRFEVVDSELKLVDTVWVDQAIEDEIEITLIAQDTGGVYDAIQETFVITVIANQSPFHNDDDPFDVNDDDRVSVLDALLIINYLNQYGPGPVGQGDPGYGYDVNGDGFVTVLDALLIINELNRRGNPMGGSVGGEGEPDAPAVIPEGDSVENTQDSNLNSETLEDLAGQAKLVAPDTSSPNLVDVDVDAAEDATVARRTEQIDEALRLLSDD